jgi:cytochrome c-type biogenesis protein CcmH
MSRGSGRLSGALVGAALAIVAVALSLTWIRGQATLTQDQQVQQIAAGLRCPVCEDLSAADSPAPLARQMRVDIQRQVAAGVAAGDIRQGFVDAYGPSVLLTPPDRGWGRAARLLPIVVVGGAGLAGGLLIRRALRRPDPGAASSRSLSAEDRERVERALARLVGEER